MSFFDQPSADQSSADQTSADQTSADQTNGSAPDAGQSEPAELVTESPAMGQVPAFEVPEVVRLATMDDLDSLSADLDSIDLTLAELDQPARPEASVAAPNR